MHNFEKREGHERKTNLALILDYPRPPVESERADMLGRSGGQSQKSARENKRKGDPPNPRSAILGGTL